MHSSRRRNSHYYTYRNNIVTKQHFTNHDALRLAIVLVVLDNYEKRSWLFFTFAQCLYVKKSIPSFVVHKRPVK
jgi:hypothetical protein